MCADDFIELHADVKHWKVEVEGDPDLCFTARVNPQVEQEGEPTPLPQAVDELLNNQATTEETLEALRVVVDIDDDNDPAPEIIPAPTDISSSSIFGEWGHEGVCFRKQQGNQNIHAKLNVALVTEFRQPLQVQSHLEMPRILVQLGHIQRTLKLAPLIDPKWSPTWSLRRYQAICPLRSREGRYVHQISRAQRTHSRP